MFYEMLLVLVIEIILKPSSIAIIVVFYNKMFNINLNMHIHLLTSKRNFILKYIKKSKAQNSFIISRV